MILDHRALSQESRKVIDKEVGKPTEQKSSNSTRRLVFFTISSWRWQLSAQRFQFLRDMEVGAKQNTPLLCRFLKTNRTQPEDVSKMSRARLEQEVLRKI